MTKTASAKTNGHPVDAIRAVATRAATRAVPKPIVKAAVRAPAKVAAKAIKAPAKTAVKAAAKKAPPRKPARVAAKKTVAAPAVARPAAKTSAKAAPKAAVKKAPKTVSARVEAERETLGKPKLVRDSFTMPELEYAVLAQVKKACLKAGFEIKKSELLRIGVALISKIGTPELKRILADLPQLKTGRPKNS